MSAEKRLDFVVIGAGRSGTTWLWQLLRRHPECFVPVEKELHYFNREALDAEGKKNSNFDRSLEWYHRFFAGADPALVWGEISPGYLWSETAPERIRAYNPAIRVLALLRDPVERTFSHYLYRVQRGNTGMLSFEEAIEESPLIVERSLYGKFLMRYRSQFPAEQLHVFLHQDLRRDPREFAFSVEQALGVRQIAPNELLQAPVNASGVPRHPRLNQSLHLLSATMQRYRLLADLKSRLASSRAYGWVRGFRNQVGSFQEPLKVRSSTELRLRKYFRDDVCLLEDLLSTDLSEWKAGRRLGAQ